MRMRGVTVTVHACVWEGVHARAERERRSIISKRWVTGRKQGRRYVVVVCDIVVVMVGVRIGKGREWARVWGAEGRSRVG